MVHILPYDPQCHELFAIYYEIDKQKKVILHKIMPNITWKKLYTREKKDNNDIYN